MGHEDSRESEYAETYAARNEGIISLIEQLDSDIVCIQEFWVANKEFNKMYHNRLSGRYSFHQLERTGGRGDGLVTLLKHHIQTVDKRDIIFKDLGDRVAMLLRLRLPGPTPTDCHREFVLINTHLLFPHQPYFSIIRLRELRKILGYLELYLQQCTEKHLPIVMCGDFNGSPTDSTYQLLKERNFTSSCSDETCWVTHKAHTGDLVCCDYIFVQNPKNREGPLEQYWQDMVFRSTKQRIAVGRSPGPDRQREIANKDPVRKWEDEDEDAELAGQRGGVYDAHQRGDCDVQPEDYRYALENLGFGQVAAELSDDQIQKLMTGPDRIYADQDQLLDEREAFHFFDTDQDGAINTFELQRLSSRLGTFLPPEALTEAFSRLVPYLSPDGEVDSAAFERWWREDMEPIFSMEVPQGGTVDEAMFSVKNAIQQDLHVKVSEAAGLEMRLVHSSVSPPQLRSGQWPDSYELSDHGAVTCHYVVDEVAVQRKE